MLQESKGKAARSSKARSGNRNRKKKNFGAENKTKASQVEETGEIPFDDGEPLDDQAAVLEAVEPNPDALPKDDDGLVSIRLSNALIRKIRYQAADEGIGVEDFIEELLAESVTLRAWEILEKKSTMRGGNTRQQHQSREQSGGRFNSRSGGRKSGNRGGMSQGRYQNIMEDKASFLEYVRNQERNRR